VEKIEWRKDLEVANPAPKSTVMPQRIPSPTPGSPQGGGW
jgi:vacuolar protein sorting-associated protein 29